ncbi:hypothetical protein Avbf_11145 [Armadillidium vulgare]|nr:hypothetical protein Avbf_11145 [Armadillidium vulgare]
MGVTWISEVVSWQEGSCEYWFLQEEQIQQENFEGWSQDLRLMDQVLKSLNNLHSIHQENYHRVFITSSKLNRIYNMDDDNLNKK